VNFDGDLVRNDSGAVVDALPRTEVAVGSRGCELESWVTILQRAYLQAKGVDWRDWRDVDADGTVDPGHAMKALTGLSSNEYRLGWSTRPDKDRIMHALRYNKPVVACTVDREWRLSTKTLVTNHCYSVIGCYTRSDGKTMLRVRNPWGEDGGTDDVSRGYDGVDDGVLELTWDDFAGSMQNYWING